ILITMSKCKFGYLTRIYGWNRASFPVSVMADNCYFEGFNVLVTDDTENIRYHVSNSTIDMTKSESRFSRAHLPNKCTNVDFLLGPGGLRAFRQEKNYTLVNCRFYNYGVDPEEASPIFINTYASFVIEGAELYGFDGFGDNGVIQIVNTPGMVVLNGVRFYDCGSGVAIWNRSQNLVLVNSVDMSGTLSGIREDSIPPAESSGNYFPGSSAP